MFTTAKALGKNVVVTDVSGNVNERLTPHCNVIISDWILHAKIEIDAPHFKFEGRASDLLRKHGMLVLVNGSNVTSWYSC